MDGCDIDLWSTHPCIQAGHSLISRLSIHPSILSCDQSMLTERWSTLRQVNAYRQQVVHPYMHSDTYVSSSSPSLTSNNSFAGTPSPSSASCEYLLCSAMYSMCVQYVLISQATDCTYCTLVLFVSSLYFETITLLYFTIYYL